MHSARSPDDEMYPYEYRYYRKPTMQDVTVQNNERDLRRSQVHKYGDAESELLYSCKPSEHAQGGSYAEPTMPYYVVPVLYVPKRVVPNEEIQPTHVQPLAKNKQTRCYTKSTQEIDQQYERYRAYYSQYYAGQGNTGDNGMGTGLVDDESYYNVQYSGSSTTFKDEMPADYSQSYSYTYMPKTKAAIRNLKSQPVCVPQDYEAKVNTARGAYGCTQRKSRHETNAYYYPNNKQVYYENLEPQQQGYYPYQSEVPQHYSRVNEYKPIANQVPVAENKPTRISGSNKANENKAPKIEEKPRLSQITKNLIERGTQTLEVKINTGTISTQTDIQEKKSMIPSCRPKVQIENVYSDEEDKVAGDVVAKAKENRRCPSAKRPSNGYQGVDQHPTRMPSPTRRPRKF